MDSKSQRTYDDTMFRETFEHHFTWLNGFMRNVTRFADKIALIDPVYQSSPESAPSEKTWTYSQLNKEANRLAHALRLIGIGKNDVVTAVLMNCPEFAFGFTGPRKIGAIFNPVNFNLSAGDISRLIDHNQPKALIYSASTQETVLKALSLARFKPLKIIMADNTKNAALPESHITYNDFVKDMPDTNPQIDFVPNIYDEVLRLCTSGITSLPKSVPLNDLNEVLSAHNIAMNFKMDSDDISLHMTPWFHRGGNDFVGPGAAFYIGACVVVSRSFMPKQYLAWVEQYKITFLTGAPFEKEACIRYMETLTPHIYNGYGTTESFCNTTLRPKDLPQYAGTVGAPCVDDEVRVVKIYDDKKAEPDDLVPTDGKTTGEVIIWCSCTGSASYCGNPEENAKKYYKGWMYTGDIGTWTSDLFVTIKGRKDDMIISSGENIYPAQIEEALCSLSKIKEAIVTSVPDKLRGQAITAYVVPEDPSVTAEQIAKECACHPDLAPYQYPRYYKITDKLPMTATGKKQHFVIKQQAEPFPVNNTTHSQSITRVLPSQ